MEEEEEGKVTQISPTPGNGTPPKTGWRTGGLGGEDLG